MSHSNRQILGLLVVFLACLRFFYSYGLSTAFDAFQINISNTFQLSLAETGFLSSLFFYTEAALIIPAGLMFDRLSPRKLANTMLLVAVLGVVLMANAHNFMTLMIARILMGGGAAFQFAGCVRVIISWMTGNMLGKGMGVLVTLGILGGVMMQAPLAYLLSIVDWREALMYIAVIGVIIAIVGYIFVPDQPKDFQLSSSALEVRGLSVLSRLKLAFMNRQNILCGIYVGIMDLPLFMLGAAWGITYMVHVNGISSFQAASVCSMIFIGVLIGSPLAGILSDYMGSRTRPMQWGAVFTLGIMLLIIFIKTDQVFLQLILYFLLGLFSSSQMIAFPTVIESNSKGISTSATSVISVISIVIGGWSQSLFGYIASHLNYEGAIWILPLAFALSFGVSYAIRETHCRAVN